MGTERKYNVDQFQLEEILNGKSVDGLRAWFNQVDRLRRAIVHKTSMFERLNETPNPYYGVLPFDGSLILCESYEYPQCFYTPLGKWAITGGGFCDGKTAEVILNELGIKWTRLSKPSITDMGQFGGLIQIDEDHFGNKYTPVNQELGFNISIMHNEGNEIRRDYHTSMYLFDLINTSDLLRNEKE